MLETGKLWRLESSKDGKTTMIHTPTFAEKRDAMKAASYMDALEEKAYQARRQQARG